MKKYLSFVMAGIMALSLTACGSSESSSKKDSSSKTSKTEETVQNDGNNTADVNPVELVFFPQTSSDAGAYATVKISSDIKMDDESAWLGLCPAGKNYITEIEADETDIIYFYYDYREDGEPYVYACDFSGVDDGTYALVVCTSDDENVGYVAIQLEMTKNGEELSFDYSNAEIKERPAKPSQTEENPSETEEKTSQAEEDPAMNDEDDTADVNPVELAFFPKTSPDEGAYATIKVSPEVKMDDESAWLGLCPAGKNYITEIEADESDIIYFHYYYSEDDDTNVFACDFSTVEDGTYALVVCTSDDENVGYVAIQLEMTKKGEDLSFDYSNAEIKDRPAD